MVWKRTKRVAFGVKGKWVIALYCDAAGNTGGAPGFKANVGNHCVDAQKVNKCFNKYATDHHNAFRINHEASNLKWDGGIAKTIQLKMNAATNIGSDVNLDVTGTYTTSNCI